MNIKAFDIMTKEVITVHESTNLQELVEMFIEKKLSGVPVVDDNENLVGVISKTDLVTHGLEKELSALLGKKMNKSAYVDLPDLDNMLGPDPGHETVGDIMTVPVITESPNSTLKELVKTLLENKIHRIVISEDNKIKGIVTTMDILKLIDRELI